MGKWGMRTGLERDRKAEGLIFSRGEARGFVLRGLRASTEAEDPKEAGGAGSQRKKRVALGWFGAANQRVQLLPNGLGFIVERGRREWVTEQEMSKSPCKDFQGILEDCVQ